jgi:hypothetical protein
MGRLSTGFGPEHLLVELIERLAFYERTKTAYAVLMTGEIVKYENIILKKGVVPHEATAPYDSFRLNATIVCQDSY